MTADNPLTPHERKLLGILRANGDWMTRRAIAQAMYFGLLSAPYKHALHALVAAGVIELRSGQIRYGLPRYEYRAITPPPADEV